MNGGWTAAQAPHLADALANTFSFIAATPGLRRPTHHRQTPAAPKSSSPNWIWGLKTNWKEEGKERGEADATLWQPGIYF